MKAIKEQDRRGGTCPKETDAGACVSDAIIPQPAPECNTRPFSPCLSQLLDQATVRLEQHIADARHHLAASAHHIRLARRAQRIRAELERLVV